MFPSTMVQQKLLNRLTSEVKINKKNVVPSVDPAGDPRSVPSYVPSVNPSRVPSYNKLGVYRKKGGQHLNNLKP